MIKSKTKNKNSDLSLNGYDLILGSNSPRRRQLLSAFTTDFSILVSDYDEKYNKSQSAKKYVLECTLNKAIDVFKKCQLGQFSNPIVICADTIVVHKNTLLFKPTDKTQAQQMLQKLSNSTHQVMTAVCVKSLKHTFVSYSKSTIVFDKFSQTEIDNYIATNSPFDKAGGYGIQDAQIAAKVKKIKGDTDTVVGLSLDLTKKLLDKIIKIDNKNK
ncbi:MAG: Maf family protein [Firmicutes bacterium]|nr:Maf family protein [Bacillota bacterium]